MISSRAIRNIRCRVLRELGALPQEEQELLLYNTPAFDTAKTRFPAKLPLPSEAHVESWKRYLVEAAGGNLCRVLQSKLVQLQFPIEKGISSTDLYRAVTLRGLLHSEAKGSLNFQQPDKLQLVIHAGLAGEIPVLITGDRKDFVTLVRALTARNEPVPVPDSMGACTVRGYNNWDRIRERRRQGDDPGELDWPEELDHLMKKKELYQDRFFILSDGPYSGVSAVDLGLTEEEWKTGSLAIRLAHEGVHYFTERIFGTMKNVLHDELIADYIGITEATGEFKKAWFMRFFGLEKFSDYRSGGRLENYKGKPPLSEGAFRILCHLVHRAAENLEYFDNHCNSADRNPWEKCARLFVLASLSVEELAGTDGGKRLVGEYRKYGVGQAR
jgi:hypothetical protein